MTAATDFTNLTLGRVATLLARSVGARKTGQGCADHDGNRSRYYHLPDGRGLRISDHDCGEEQGLSPVSIDLVIDLDDGEASISIDHLEPGAGWFKTDTTFFDLGWPDDAASDETFCGDGAAWTAAIKAKLIALFS